MGEAATIRALTRLGVEPRGSGLAARVTVRNTGGGNSSQTLRLDVDGRTATRVDLDLPAGETLERVVELPPGTGSRPSSRGRTCSPPTTTSGRWLPAAARYASW